MSVYMDTTRHTGAPTEMRLTDRVMSENQQIHAEAERHSFLVDLMKGTLPIEKYHQHLVDLEHVYSTMEKLIQNLPSSAFIDKFNPLYRAEALEKDLKDPRFSGISHTPTQAAADYANYLATLDDLHLFAHAYVRYLGDLSGGRIIYNRIKDRLPTAMHEFPGIIGEGAMGINKFKTEFKDLLCANVKGIKEEEKFIKEAKVCFERAIGLFNAA